MILQRQSPIENHGISWKSKVFMILYRDLPIENNELPLNSGLVRHAALQIIGCYKFLVIM